MTIEKKPLTNQPSRMPTRKVTASTAGAAIGALILALIDRFAPGALEGIRAEVGAALVTLCTLAAGWLVRERTE